MSVGLLSLGSSALKAAYTQLQVTGSNIANVNTPGYTRQEAVLGAVEGQYTGGGFVGRGVDVLTIRRRYDEFLVREVQGATAAAGADRTRAEMGKRLETLFGDAGNGIGQAMDDVDFALADVANRPFDVSARTAAMRRFDDLGRRVQSLDGQMRMLGKEVDQRIERTVGTINTTLAQLARVNGLIADRSSLGQPPNDLLDTRDRLVEDVNRQLRANAFVNPDGSVNLYTQGGEALVIGGRASELAVESDLLDGQKLRVMLRANGANLPLNPATLGGGEMAGLLRFRDEDLASAIGGIGRLVAAYGDAFNRQQALGVDANGNAGQPLFTIGAPLVNAASTNAGNAVLQVTIADGRQLAATDYRIAFDGTNATLTRTADGSTVTVAGWPASVDGLTFNLQSGALAAGDQLYVRAGTAYGQGFGTVSLAPSRIAAASPVAAQRGAANAGDVVVRGLSVDAVGANLTQPVTITFTAPNTFSVSGVGTGNPTGVAYVPGQPISFNGWRLVLDGVPAAGDTVSVGLNPSPATDNGNARRLVALAADPLVAGSPFSDAFAGVVGDLGARTQQAVASETMSRSLLTSALETRSSVSGVNLDEEAVRMLQFQQAYQAASKVIATAQNMIDTLLGVMR